ncbi:hypothetical protein ATO67_20420 [Agrobacterium bohemicum]|uniref:Uncharacterized protein n=1 Tax=Agrobacterium bohemicum TaxID=2052828 RepID=A0A135P6S5_9HYPH|nr:hypothetical protein ATO67_20420 [Agrobacterium bohemicum]
MALLFSIKEFSVHEKIVQLEMYRDSMCQAWDTFSDARRELRSVMNVDSIDGGLVSSTVDLKKNPEARLRILEIDSLIRSILENAPHFLEVGRDAVGSLGPAFRKSFADPTFPSVEITKIKRED